ncbi:MAG TPA: UDP-N-acetylmuramoyl-L-alanyl-D-glutamate--2,6-diaminopimelate ligase [Gammaproteobacteria bacterium]
MAALQDAAGWTLAQLLDGRLAVPPAADRALAGLCVDSRGCTPGALFLALPGTRGHGLAHLDAACRAGAVAALYDPDGALPPAGAALPLLPLPGLRHCYGELADRFHGEPSRVLAVLGVTGTNGKSSVCHFLAGALDRPGARCGVLGTLGNGWPGALAPATHTTPDAVTVHALLAELRAGGATRVAMEVSSHALDQGRVGGVRFDTAVFTNLTHEHLDYHGGMQQYAAAKQRLFTQPGLRRAALNVDDPCGRAWLAALPRAVSALGYGFAADAAVRGAELEAHADGFTLTVHTPAGRGVLHSGLLGRFNASNLLATLAVLLLAGLELDDALARLAAVRGVPGRMERFGGGDGPLVVVDYAHTPDALAVALAALREHCRGRLWCVFGCGGDRDAAKRPLMGAVAAAAADRVIVTDDNPRREDGAAIARAIVAGMPAGHPVEVLRDRAAAIGAALAAAAADDVVLVAGKGHELTQQVGDELRPFSDRALVRRLVGEAAA